jgi:hypothetical protein
LSEEALKVFNKGVSVEQICKQWMFLEN